MKHCNRIDQMTEEDFLDVVARGLRLVPCYFLNEKPPAWAAFRRPSDDVWMDQPEAGFIFDQPSSRTLGSLRKASELYGFLLGYPFLGNSSSMVKGEPSMRTALTALGQHCEIIFYRAANIGTPSAAAYYLERRRADFPDWFGKAPIINGGDGPGNHPTQIILDWVTMAAYRLGMTTHNTEGALRLKARLENMSDDDLKAFVKEMAGKLKMVMVGDLVNTRAVNSEIDLAKIMGFKLILVAPEPFQVPRWKLRDVDATRADTLEDAFDLLRSGQGETGDDFVVVCTNRFKTEHLKDIPGLPLVEAEEIVESLRIDAGCMRTLEEFDGIVIEPQPLDRHRPIIDVAVWEHPRVIMDFQSTVGTPSRVGVISHCWEHRGDHIAVPEVPTVEPHIIDQAMIDAHMEKMAPKWAEDQQQRSVNPLDNGMVLDRLLRGNGPKTDFLLEKGGAYGDGGSSAIIAKRRRSTELRTPEEETQGIDGQKDIIFAEDVFYAYELLAAMRLFNDDMRVIRLEEGKYWKMAFDLAEAIERILNCPTEMCVSRTDPEVRSFFHVENLGNEPFFHCEYCRGRFDTKQIKKAA